MIFTGVLFRLGQGGAVLEQGVEEVSQSHFCLLALS